MHYAFGQYLRNRYEGFLSPVYSQKEITVYSSDADRGSHIPYKSLLVVKSVLVYNWKILIAAIMSALSNMAGMWPPTPKDPKSEWNEDLPWQPIPVHTIPKKLDNVISH